MGVHKVTYTVENSRKVEEPHGSGIYNIFSKRYKIYNNILVFVYFGMAFSKGFQLLVGIRILWQVC